MKNESDIYHPTLIEFARIGVEVASLLEDASSHTRSDFVDKAIKLLPLLYLKTLLLPVYEYDDAVDYAPEYITETGYEAVRCGVERAMGAYDTFLTTDHPDMRYSEVPIGASVSEYLADVYQQVGNLLGVLREENTEAVPAAIGRCLHYFADYWGRHLLSALTVLHQVHFGPEDEDAESVDQEVNPFI